MLPFTTTNNTFYKKSLKVNNNKDKKGEYSNDGVRAGVMSRSRSRVRQRGKIRHIFVLLKRKILFQRSTLTFFVEILAVALCDYARFHDLEVFSNNGLL